MRGDARGARGAARDVRGRACGRGTERRRSREREGEEPPRQRTRLRRIEIEESSTSGDSDTSEVEFELEGRVRGDGVGRAYPSYLNKRSECRESRFCENRDPSESNFCQEPHFLCRDPTIHLKI